MLRYVVFQVSDWLDFENCSYTAYLIRATLHSYVMLVLRYEILLADTINNGYRTLHVYVRATGPSLKITAMYNAKPFLRMNRRIYLQERSSECFCYLVLCNA